MVYENMDYKVTCVRTRSFDSIFKKHLLQNQGSLSTSMNAKHSQVDSLVDSHLIVDACFWTESHLPSQDSIDDMSFQ